MSTKDYIEFAEMISNLPLSKEDRRVVAARICLIFAMDNTRFSQAKFILAYHLERGK